MLRFANCQLKTDYFSLMDHVKFVHECKQKFEKEVFSHISHVKTIKSLKREAAETRTQLIMLMEVSDKNLAFIGSFLLQCKR